MKHGKLLINAYNYTKCKLIEYPKSDESDVGGVPVGAPLVKEDETLGSVGSVVLKEVEEGLEPSLVLAVCWVKHGSQGLESINTSLRRHCGKKLILNYLKIRLTYDEFL